MRNYLGTLLYELYSCLPEIITRRIACLEIEERTYTCSYIIPFEVMMDFPFIPSFNFWGTKSVNCLAIKQPPVEG